MKRTVLFLAAILLFISGLKAQTRTIITKDGKVVTELKKESFSRIAMPEKTYHYVKANELFTTQGAYEGQLLHGMTSFYDEKGQLVSKGIFKNGLKQGKWMYWNEEGRLIEIVHWKKGIKNGYYKGLTTKDSYVIGSWKNNLKHGTWQTFVNGELKNIEFYKHGESVQPKVKKPRKKRFKITLFKEKKEELENEKIEDIEEKEDPKDDEQKS